MKNIQLHNAATITIHGKHLIYTTTTITIHEKHLIYTIQLQLQFMEKLFHRKI